MVEAESGQIAGGGFFRHWRLHSPVKGVILLVHGLGEHSGRYRDFADFFQARGFAVVAPDLPGHGRSGGPRAYVERFADFLTPLEILRARIRLWYPQVPCFLVGHSMGGLIAARYLLDHQADFHGAALSGAALALAEPPPAPLLLLNALLARLCPRVGTLQLDASQVSRDPEVVRAYREDPLVHHGKVSARLVSELFRAMEEVEKRRGSLRLPLLLMHGEADVMTPSAGSRALYESVSSQQRQLRIYPHLYHEIFNEPERLDVLGEVADWLQERLSPAA